MSRLSDSNFEPAGTSPTQSNFQRRTSQIGRPVLYLALAAAVGAFVYAGYQAMSATQSLHESQDRTVEKFNVTTPIARHLAPELADADGNLLADPPTDPQKFLNPETLVLSYGEDSDLDVQPVNWEEFKQHLARATGKQVIGQTYDNTVTDVADIKDGKIHVIALHSADAPYLVNHVGFVPVAVLGTEGSAIGNHLDLAVPPSSSIKTLSDLRGRTLTCTQPTSITGHRAAVATLLTESKMRPDVDYTITFSMGQTRSITGLVAGDYQAVALSDDKLQTLLKAGRVKPADYRIIYESQIIPRYTIGYVYNLEPELAKKVTEAVLSFKNEGGAKADGIAKSDAETSEAGGSPWRFFAIDYKKDFEFMRKIDESFDPRLGSKKVKAKAATNANEPAADHG